MLWPHRSGPTHRTGKSSRRFRGGLELRRRAQAGFDNCGEDAASRRKLGAVPPRRSAAGPRGEVPGGAWKVLRARYGRLLDQVVHPALRT